MRKYIAEFIGTFFLVLTIGCTVIPGKPGVIPPLAIGAVLMVMIYAGGHVSGAHFNPAVTLAVWIRGRCDTKDVFPYWGAQVLAGIVAALVAVFLVGKSGTPMEIKSLPEAFDFHRCAAFADEEDGDQGGHDANQEPPGSVCGRVSVHLRPGVRGAECRHRQGQRRKFLLRPRHRHDSYGRRVCGRI